MARSIDDDDVAGMVFITKEAKEGIDKILNKGLDDMGRTIFEEVEKEILKELTKKENTNEK